MRLRAVATGVEQEVSKDDAAFLLAQEDEDGRPLWERVTKTGPQRGTRTSPERGAKGIGRRK